MGKDEVEKLVGSVYKRRNSLQAVVTAVIAVSIVLAVCIAVAIRSAMTPRRRSCRGRTGTTDTFRSGACL